MGADESGLKEIELSSAVHRALSSNAVTRAVATSTRAGCLGRGDRRRHRIQLECASKKRVILVLAASFHSPIVRPVEPAARELGIAGAWLSGDYVSSSNKVLAVSRSLL
jgi:hypothetical protein